MLLWFATFSCSACANRRPPHVLAALSPAHAVEFALRHEFLAFVVAGRGHARRHRRRGALCRHGPFRPHADPRRMAPARAAIAPRQLLWARRAAAGRSQRGREPVLPARTVVGALSARGTCHGGDGDRLTGHHFRRLLHGPAGGSAWPEPARAIQHTSISEFGQIYVPAVNWLQLAGVVGSCCLQTSTNLAAAYGIAVTGTMLVTTLLVFGWRCALEMELAAGRPVFASSWWSTERSSPPTW